MRLMCIKDFSYVEINDFPDSINKKLDLKLIGLAFTNGKSYEYSILFHFIKFLDNNNKPIYFNNDLKYPNEYFMTIEEYRNNQIKVLGI